MEKGLLLLLAVAVVAMSVPAQPVDGDLIVSCRAGSGGGTFFVSPTSPSGKWTTILWHISTHPTAVKMAANNSDLIESRTNYQLVRVNPVTKSTSILSSFSGRAFSDMALDHDGAWVVCGMDWSLNQNALWLFTTPATLATISTVPWIRMGNFNDAIAIDREPMALGPYVVGRYVNSSPSRPPLTAIRRNGAIATIVTGGLPLLHGISVDPASGDYVVAVEKMGLFRVSKNGATTVFLGNPFGHTISVRSCQDGSVWVAGDTSRVGCELKKVSTNGTVLRTIPLPGLSPAFPTNIEIYGRRRLVCTQQANAVNIRLKSQRPGDRGMPYVLACSFNRRPPAPLPCLQFPGGERLFLDYTDPLFLTSALGLAPHVFQKFQGITNASGFAPATVRVRSPNPPWNITVFVAGVILNPAGVTVTNTHWFVL